MERSQRRFRRAVQSTLTTPPPSTAATVTRWAYDYQITRNLSEILSHDTRHLVANRNDLSRSYHKSGPVHFHIISYTVVFESDQLVSTLLAFKFNRLWKYKCLNRAPSYFGRSSVVRKWLVVIFLNLISLIPTKIVWCLLVSMNCTQQFSLQGLVDIGTISASFYSTCVVVYGANIAGQKSWARTTWYSITAIRTRSMPRLGWFKYCRTLSECTDWEIAEQLTFCCCTLSWGKSGISVTNVQYACTKLNTFWHLNQTI